MLRLAILFLILGCGGCSTFNAPNPAPSATSSQKISAPTAGCYLGAFVGTVESSYIEDFESRTGKKLAAVMWYVSFTENFPTAECNLVKHHGSLPFITWEPWRGVMTDETYSLDNLISGNFDAYLTAWSQACANYGQPLFLRFGHEMNGNWYPWDGYHNQQNPQKFINAWKHIYAIFSAQGVNNVTWVWCPNSTSVPAESWNTIPSYYPGDEYVDWIGLDGYNWGGSSFAEIFSATYTLFKNTYPSKPILIGEFSSTENGGSKAAWISDALYQLSTNYPRISLFNWFNLNKETDWRINSSASAESAFQQALDNTYFLESITIN